MKLGETDERDADRSFAATSLPTRLGRAPVVHYTSENVNSREPESPQDLTRQLSHRPSPKGRWLVSAAAPAAKVGFVILGTSFVTSVLILNVVLFLPVVLGGIAASWFGWVLAGRGGAGDGGAALQTPFLAADPRRPWPVAPRGSAGPGDLARSA